MAITHWQKLAQYSHHMGLGPLWVRRNSVSSSDAQSSSQPSRPKVETTQVKEINPRLIHLTSESILSAKTHLETNHPLVESKNNTIPLDPNPLPTWDMLQQQIKHCESCRLAKTRLHTVFGRGSVDAKWLLIGEAPGKNEDEQGLAFVGRAGKLLDNILFATGLDSNIDVFMTNVLKCRPPANRNPAEDEMIACQDFLGMQIAKIKPTLMMALGRFAVQALLSTKKNISSLRGKVHNYQGIPLIVTFHPAYLLRNLPEKAKAWQDFLLARDTAAGLTK